MPIVLSNIDGKQCPQIVCDVCGEAIDDAAEGCYLWDFHAVPEMSNGTHFEPAFAHRGKCFCFALKKMEDRGAFVGDMTLDFFMVCLCNSLGLNTRKLLPEGRTRTVGMLGSI